MVIKLKTDISFACITDSFVDASEVLLHKRMEHTSNRKERINLQRFLSEQGFDQMKTRLRRLKYEKYANIRYKDHNYLYGLTQDIIVTLDGGKYNVGPYHIFLPHKAFLVKNLGEIHFVPDRAKMTGARHLHHTAHSSYGDDPNNPLDMSPHTCWASIGPSLKSALMDGDIADCFRVLYLFLIRLNPSSPLSRDWSRQIRSVWGQRVEK